MRSGSEQQVGVTMVTVWSRDGRAALRNPCSQVMLWLLISHRGGWWLGCLQLVRGPGTC